MHIYIHIYLYQKSYIKNTSTLLNLFSHHCSLDCLLHFFRHLICLKICTFFQMTYNQLSAEPPRTYNDIFQFLYGKQKRAPYFKFAQGPKTYRASPVQYESFFLNFLTNCCRDTLMSIAKHYETGETLPEDVYRKLLAARTFRAGSLSLRQVTCCFLLHIISVEFEFC